MSPRRPHVHSFSYTVPSYTGHSATMAALLRAELQRRDITQRAFAELVGASEARVSLVLRGIRRADPATLDRWAGALGMEWRIELVRAARKNRRIHGG